MSGDGDTVFALASNVMSDVGIDLTRIYGMDQILVSAVSCVSEAIVKAVKNAKGVAGIPGLGD